MAKGRKTGGRTKGTPNRVASAAKEAFLATFGKLDRDLEKWIRECAEGQEVTKTDKEGNTVKLRMGADPGKAADLLIRMAEYHFPKLGRQEVVGDGGGPVEFVIRDVAAEK
jgi:hypothetical protein